MTDAQNKINEINKIKEKTTKKKLKHFDEMKTKLEAAKATVVDF